jgi:hypothetical protein
MPAAALMVVLCSMSSYDMVRGSIGAGVTGLPDKVTKLGAEQRVTVRDHI